MQKNDPLKLDGMALEPPPETLRSRPNLPSPPRTPLWHQDPDIPYTLSTHIIDAAPFRTSPEITSLEEVTLVAYNNSQDSDAKARHKLVKESVEQLWEWRKDVDESTPTSGKLSKYRQPLWICLNRYVKKDLEKMPRKNKGLSLIFVHPIGCTKETWEPLIQSLLKSPAGRDVEEIFSWEAVNTGDSALLNAGKLNQLSDWNDNTADFIHLLLHYVPSRVTSDALPVYLPRITQAEFEERVRAGFSGRRIIAIGHSLGGYICARACLAYPKLFSALVLIDPGIITRSRQNIKQTLTALARFSLARRDSWSSKEEAFASLMKSPIYSSWHPDVLKIFVETGLHSSSSGGVTWKMHPVYEAFTNLSARKKSEDMYDVVPDLDINVYIKWIMPDERNGGGIGNDPKLSALLVKERPGNTSNVNLLNSAHMIPMEQPSETAREVANTIEVVSRVSARM